MRALSDAVPDHSTICRFHNLLIEQALLAKLFAELGRQLDKAGLILRRGTMLDATVIETTAARLGGDEPGSDPDARFARPRRPYGYKVHVGIGEGAGIIHAVVTTPANVNDTVPADALIRGDERAVLADAAYHTHAREAASSAIVVSQRLRARCSSPA